MADRTVTINSLSKTYSVTGWRVGWTISPPSLTGAIRKVHDFLTVGAAAPLQEAGVVALTRAGQPTTPSWRAAYQRRRDLLLDILERHHFTCYKPHGAYYIMTDISAFGVRDDVQFARYLVKDVGRGGGAGQQLLPAIPPTGARSCDSASARRTRRSPKPIAAWPGWRRLAFTDRRCRATIWLSRTLDRRAGPISLGSSDATSVAGDDAEVESLHRRTSPSRRR